MHDRNDILNWVEQGRLMPDALPTALRLAGVTPTRSDWRRFLDRLALWLGTLFCAIAVIFFFAYNWQAMGRFTKFALVETLLPGTIALCWRLGLDQLSGKIALLAATLLAGALLALVGQTYQTGADPYTLFAFWALAVFPWVVVGRFGPLWLFWTGLLNLAIVLYFQTVGGLPGALSDTERLLWILFGFNTAALCAWEFAAWRGLAWLRERWPVRVLAVASGSLITALAVWTIIDFHSVGSSALLAYLVWMMAAYLVYRRLLRDAFVLAGGVLSAIVVATAILSKAMLRHGSIGAFLFIGLVVIGLSAVGGVWLKSVVAEERA